MKVDNAIKKIAIKIILTIIALLIVFSFMDIDQLVETMAGINLAYFLFALLLVPAFVLLKTYRWYYIVKQKADISYADAVVSYLAGNFLGLLTPARAGELSRVLYLPVNDKLKHAGLVIIDKIFDLLALALLTCAGSYYILGPELTLLIVLIFMIAVASVLSIDKISSRAKKVKAFTRLGFVVGMGEMASLKPRQFITCMVISILIFSVTLVQCYLLVIAFHAVDFIVILFSFPLIILTNILPITIAGLGVREGVSVFLLSKFGVPGIVAFNSSFLIFFINTLLPDIAGAMLVSRFNLSRKCSEKTKVLDLSHYSK